MNDDPDDEDVLPASLRLPIVTAADGQPYMPCLAVIQLLRAITESASEYGEDLDPAALLAAIDREADTLEARAILQTRPARTRPA